MLIGYARVSTADQNTSIQLAALKRAGVAQVHEEKRSAVKTRPVLDTLLDRINTGDTLVVYKLDRLARSLVQLLHIVELLDKRGAKFRSLTESLETSTPAGRLFMQMLGSFAEFERSLIRERVVAGQIAARARGQVWGRPRTLTPQAEALAVKLYSSGAWTIDEICTAYGVQRGPVRAALGRAGLISSRYLTS